MNSLVKAIAITALGCLIGQMCGCASSSLVDKWRDPGYQAPPLGKMLVIAIRKSATKRRIWEDLLRASLQRATLRQLRRTVCSPIRSHTNQVIAAVQTNGYDGVLVILGLPSEKDMQYIHGSISSPQDKVYNFYWQRYWSYYREIEHSGYLTLKRSRSAPLTSPQRKRRPFDWGATSRRPIQVPQLIYKKVLPPRDFRAGEAKYHQPQKVKKRRMIF